MGTMTSLEKVFPHKQVTYEGMTVTVTPLTVDHLLDAADAYFRMMQAKNEGKTDIEILMSAKGDLKELISKCIDIDFSRIPAAMVPMIARVVLAQNFNAEVLGNWAALFREGKEALVAMA